MRGIVIHTAGVAGDPSAASMRKYHREVNGWRDIGYHYVIRKGGRLEMGRTGLGAHTNGANDTFGICISGDGDSEPWTLAQRERAISLCRELCSTYEWSAERICGHREAPAGLGAKPTGKTCPGGLVDMNEFRAAVAAALEA